MGKNRKKSIACFFVNYNNSSKSLHCIGSLVKQAESHYEIRVFIIDNNSVEIEKDILKKYSINNSLQNISFENIFLDKNIGYFPALNYGYLKQKEFVDSCEYVIIGNNDLQFEYDFLADLETRNYKDDVFVVSPDIVNSDNNHQNPAVRYKYSKLQLIYLDLYHSSYLIACLLGFVSLFIKYRGSQKSKAGNTESQYISIGYGACYILTKMYMRKIGYIPDYLFLMNEENSLSDLVFKNNGRIYYDAELVVHHLEHSSIKLSPRLKMYRIEQESYKISKKHFNNKYLFDKKID